MSNLDLYRVAANDVWCGEYVYRINGLIRAKSDDLYKIISALLNSSGGIIQIIHAAPDTKEYDQWQNNLRSRLLYFMPPDVYHECVHLHVEGTRAFIVVFKAKVFITWNSHMYMRGSGAETTQVSYFNDIALVVNQKVKNNDSKKSSQLHRGLKDRYGETYPYPEGKHVEFKCFGEDDNTDDIIRKLKNEDKMRVLTAFGNVEGGGEMFIGIKEEGQGCIVQGQVVPEYEEVNFKQKLAEIPRTGVMNWKCNFIRVRKSIPNRKRRVVICIRVPQSPGCAFMRNPESFIVCDDGKIIKLSVEEWKLKHQVEMTSNSRTPVSSQPELNRPEQAGSHVMPTTQTKVSPFTRRVYEEGMEIKFSQHSSLFKQSDAQLTAPHRYAQANTMFRMDNPVHFTPTRQHLKVLSSEVFGLIDEGQTKRGTQAFCIADRSLLSCFAGKDTPHIDKLTKPYRVMDLLVVNSMAEICSFVVCQPLDGINNKFNMIKEYTMTLVRLIKKKVFECHLPHLIVDYKTISVRCEILDSRGHRYDMRTDTMYNNYLTWLPDTVSMAGPNLECICSALVIVLNETHFSDDIQRGSNDALAQEQIDVLLSLESRFNIIEGPPGSGKTLLAQHICQRKGRDISAYISASVPLNNRIKAFGKATVFHATDGQGIVQLLDGDLKDRLHIVIDDNHTLVYDDEVIKRICALIAGNTQKHLYVFQDSVYQNYKGGNDQSSSQQLVLQKYMRHYGSVQYGSLTKIWRNTKAVGPFIEAQVADLVLKADDIKCLSEEKGDDVVITHLQNLRADDESNGLLGYIDKISNQSSSDTRPYSPQDMVVLVDHKDPEIAMKEVEMFKKVFTTFWPESNVQSAEDFPVAGVIVDHLDSFVGLEARWVIFVLPKDARFEGKDEQSQKANVRYKIAIASRGKDRVDFVQEENLNERVAIDMKCDRCPSKFIQDNEDISRQVSMTTDIDESEAETPIMRDLTMNPPEPGPGSLPTSVSNFELGRSDTPSRASSVTDPTKNPEIAKSEAEPSITRDLTMNLSESGSESLSANVSSVELERSDTSGRASPATGRKKRVKCSRRCIIM